MQMRASKNSATLGHHVAQTPVYRHFDNMSLPRMLTNMNILIDGPQANNSETASLPRPHPTRSQFAFFAKKTPNSNCDPTHAVSKNEMRAARRVVKLANQSPNPYSVDVLIGWPGLPSWTTWPTHRTANGVGRSNFKIGPLSALNPSTSAQANFEI